MGIYIVFNRYTYVSLVELDCCTETALSSWRGDRFAILKKKQSVTASPFIPNKGWKNQTAASSVWTDQCGILWTFWNDWLSMYIQHLWKHLWFQIKALDTGGCSLQTIYRVFIACNQPHGTSHCFKVV